MPDLTDIWYSAIQGNELPQVHLKFVEGELRSKNPERKVMANSILFMAADSQAREYAFTRLKEMCEAWDWRGKPRAAAVLLLTIERLSKQQIQDSDCFAKYVYAAAAQPHVPARLNSMRVLRKLAKIGDSKAIEILKSS